jgi:hypothetical protein
MWDDFSNYLSKGARRISIVDTTKGDSSANRISIVAPGGSGSASKTSRTTKAAEQIADEQMAIALGGAQTSSKKKGKKGKKGKAKKGKTKGGKVQKRSASAKKPVITKGKVRVALASGKTKSVSATALVRKLPTATVVKAVTAYRPSKAKGGGKKKKGGGSKKKKGKGKKKH